MFNKTTTGTNDTATSSKAAIQHTVNRENLAHTLFREKTIAGISRVLLNSRTTYEHERRPHSEK